MKTLILNPKRIKKHHRKKRNPQNLQADFKRKKVVRPVFYDFSTPFGKELKLSPLTRVRKKYKKISNPALLKNLKIEKIPNVVLNEIPNVIGVMGGVIGTEYIYNVIPLDFIKMNSPVRILSKIAIGGGLSYVINMINKNIGKYVFLGSMVNVLMDVYNTYLSNMINLPMLSISSGSLPVSNTTTGATTDSTTGTTSGETQGLSALVDISKEFSSIVDINNEIF